MVLVTFIGLQIYKSSVVSGETLNNDSEVAAEVVISEENYDSDIAITNFDDKGIEILKQDLELVPLVKTNIVKKPVIVEKEVIKKKINSNIKTEVIGTFKVSGFCNCSICSKNNVSKDIMGSYEGVNVVSNSSEIPFGTKIWIDGVGLRQTQPSGQKLTKNEIKVYFKTHEEVVDFGVQEIEVYKVVD